MIGRSLDVTVQVQAEATEEVSASCIGADVYYADARQASTAAVVGVPPTGSGQSMLLRIQSSAMVDEPVVTVLLRSSCGASHVRRYVLLAELPAVMSTKPVTLPDAASGSARPLAQTGAVLPTVVLPSTASGVAPAASASPATTKLPEAAKTQVQPVKVAKKTRKPASEVPVEPLARKAVERPTGKSVLKLDPLDILSDRIDLLDSSTLFLPTEDAVRHTQQISSLQGDVKALKDLVAGNDAKLMSLRVQLEQAQAQQVPVWILYVMGTLLVLCLAALAWLWQRLRSSQSSSNVWWRDADDASDQTVLMSQAPPAPSASSMSPLAEAAPVAATPSVAVVAPPRVSKLDATQADVDLDIDLDNFLLTDAAKQSAKTAAPASARVARSRHLNDESVLDIRQQAEFFVSLGQADRAFRILKKHIAESGAPNPLIYLDLLSLYHQSGLKADFRECRDAFMQRFNAVVPDFPAFNVPDKDLENYPETLSQLSQAWPGGQALAFLDTCIFADLAPQPRPQFDLAAFRDLLMLHTLAEDEQTAAPSQDAAAASVGLFDQTPITPTEPDQTSAALNQDALSPAAPPTVEQALEEETPAVDMAPLEFSPVDDAPALAAAPPEMAGVPVQMSEPEAADHPAAFSMTVPVAPEESPSRMLDLDFSTLAAEPTEPPAEKDEGLAPIPAPTVRYATRSRWPVNKRPK